MENEGSVVIGGFCQCWMAVVGPVHRSAKKATNQSKKVLVMTMKLWKLAFLIFDRKKVATPAFLGRTL
jgi:hypothetical protein